MEGFLVRSSLQIPLHMPIKLTANLLLAETRDRDVVSVKVDNDMLTIITERRIAPFLVL